MELTGAQILWQSLKDEGVDTVFGYPGGAVIDFYDALVQYDIRHILVRHEQGAVHAADGYARASGRVGVCMVTSGPGATNTVTGIATAYLDSIPMVVITGQVPTKLIGNDAFQEVDIVGITRPCTKHNYLVKDITKLERIIKEAFYIARSGRPGPVLIDIPKDVTNSRTVYKAIKDIQMESYNPTYQPNNKQLSKVVSLIKEAKRPLIFTGGGVVLSKGSDALTRLAKRTNIPVTASLMGLGSYPGTDEKLWLGMLGMHGTFRANMATSNCDLMLAIGVRFDDRVTGKTDEFATKATIVHVDIDPTSIHKNVIVDVPVVGDCRLTLEALNELLDAEDPAQIGPERSEWLGQIQKWKDTNPLRYKQDGCDTIKPQYVVEKLFEVTKGNAIISTEVGQNQMWAAQYYHFDKPNQWLTSGGLGTMGYGFPAAIGAQMACPDRLVVDVAGDGSIQMNIQEMATAVQNGLPVKIVILNNQYLGMVRQWQELFYKKNYSQTDMTHAPDFVKLAEAYGAKGFRTAKPEEVEAVLKKGIETPGPVIMEFVVCREECVYPMVPAGAPITNMLLV
ncbi:biosynthetic-type acetolactate synthase large subunit [Desulfobotulus sp.]|jgi:acetolactate synthase-1/2/3 large subunit|uniref:biosynthetic-type acetolactate synthase large subunit n=1 Tax=Desulfobotulus sp. TaxID=1940337 RepID=UPI002A3661AB|nr:biosynthetic-type acetolactate synthase large subunit [Desulfobotulus sp.]MDY0161890.1 biosynthetic-type acetolactate synthase large subunit [Desulfobotulus sp.]